MKKSVKRITAVLLSVLMVFSAFATLPVGVFAAEADSPVASDVGTTGELIWILDDDGTLTISGNGKMVDFESDGAAPWGKQITSVIIENGVTSIGDFAFYGCSKLKSVTIADTVTRIGYAAFTRCTGLTDVTIPNSVKTISDFAFKGCSWLVNIRIGNGLTSIGEQAFVECGKVNSVYITDLSAWCKVVFYTITSNPLFGAQNLYVNNQLVTNLVIPNSVTHLGTAFSGYTGLISVTIPDSVTSISGNTFYKCTGLTSVTIPGSVTSIGRNMFYGCTGLTNVTIPDNVTSINDYAFYDCTGLTSITIPDSVTSIGDNAFEHCESLTSVTIPDSVTSIGGDAFRNCTGLTSINIPESVKTIGYYAFYGCNRLTSATIPDSVMSIRNSAFKDCTGLRAVYITDLAAWCKINFEDHLSNPLYYAHNLYINNQLVTDLVIPDSVTSIGDLAFYGYTGLKSVTIPNSVTDIGEYAFYGCTGLTNVIIPESVTSIGEKAFGYYYNYSEQKSEKIIDNFILYGKAGSVTSFYAKKNDLKFKDLNAPLIGDLNGDGSVNGADAGLLSRYTSGWKEYEEKIKNMKAADVSGDGQVNGADAGILSRYVSGWTLFAKYFE